MKSIKFSRVERVVRGLAATAFSVLFAALSHVIAGADAPNLLAILATVVVVLPLSTALAGMRLSVTRLSTIVLASQALFHTCFAMIGDHGVVSIPGAVSAHSHNPAMGTEIAHALAITPTAASAAMWASHVLAAAVTIVLLTLGERSAMTLVTIVLAALSALVGWVSVTLSNWPKLSIPVRVQPQPIALRTVSTSPRRGPPAFFA